ncbi:MAG: iron-sulfur cluster assembly scaffold protein [Desulfobacterales bacterium]|nr:iron-sulfur cluster assembly scaffold protein [Desulfobacterales bacterium]
MNEKKFDFWQDHSLNFLEMALNKDRAEKIENPDARGKKHGDCGDSIEFFLMMKDDVIENISHDVDGCMNSLACANTLAHFVEGETLTKAWEITPEKIVDYLETLPEHELHCAELALGSLFLALTDYQKKMDK